MTIYLNSNIPEFFNDISESIRAFYSDAVIVQEKAPADFVISIRLIQEQFSVKCSAVLYGAGANAKLSDGNAQFDIPSDCSALIQKRLRKRAAKLSVFRMLLKFTGIRLPWGSLTGIRPTKLIYERLSQSREQIKDELQNIYGVEASKIDLLFEIIQAQKPYIIPENNAIDVYVGIPFCRTRCVYCSFASVDATKGEKLISPYMNALIKEIRAALELVNRKNKRVRCLYIGGGTPTALDESSFAQLLSEVSAMAPYKEFTVEAGRPDTITERKLELIKLSGAERISINPQSMNEKTLELIGRKHTPEDICSCFELAEKFDFKCINTDIIAGLPGESVEDFNNTLEAVIRLAPQNITVHTLSVKKGSALAQNKGLMQTSEAQVRIMVENAREAVSSNGYNPYYLYRQKYQTGNLENVGYSLPGMECIYNIDIMEETTDILALGAGGISKRIYPENGRIERAPNCKSINDYIERIDQMISRNNLLFDQ